MVKRARTGYAYWTNHYHSFTPEVHDIFQLIRDGKEATREAGIEFAVRQCRDLLDRGAPGLHFFTLNKVEPVREIWERLDL